MINGDVPMEDYGTLGHGKKSEDRLHLVGDDTSTATTPTGVGTCYINSYFTFFWCPIFLIIVYCLLIIVLYSINPTNVMLLLSIRMVRRS